MQFQSLYLTPKKRFLISKIQSNTQILSHKVTHFFTVKIRKKSSVKTSILIAYV